MHIQIVCYMNIMFQDDVLSSVFPYDLCENFLFGHDADDDDDEMQFICKICRFVNSSSSSSQCHHIVVKCQHELVDSQK